MVFDICTDLNFYGTVLQRKYFSYFYSEFMFSCHIEVKIRVEIIVKEWYENGLSFTERIGIIKRLKGLNYTLSRQ